MKHLPISILTSVLIFVAGCDTQRSADEQMKPAQQTPQSGCQALHRLADVTIIYTEEVGAAGDLPAHCYAKGLIDGSITFHVQLPYADAWNGRLVHFGDGGADGDLDTLPYILAAGYAVTNSNTGHDTGAESRAYAFMNEQAAINFSFRAVHLTTNAAKTIVRAYYGTPQEYAYHFGCSTGGRQALLAAQLFPYDFDGIVAGAPAHRQFHRMAHRLNVEQQLFRNDFAANLAFDLDGDGRQESLTKVSLLTERVLERCDALDGIEDGIIEPDLCPFDPDEDLRQDMCPEDVDADDCFTRAQLASINLLYEGSRNSQGDLVYPGAPPGSEPQWPSVFIPHQGNNETPYALISASAVIGYSFYREDPGLIPPDLNDIDYVLDTDAALPEWGWWNFDINDVGSAQMSAQAPLMEGNDPDLERFLLRNNGKLLMFHGWADSVIPPEPSLAYHASVIDSVFGGDSVQAAEHLRLFMAPGLAHCRGGPGPDRADYLSALDAWVDAGEAPETITIRKIDGDNVSDERILCPHPARAVHEGDSASGSKPAVLRAADFRCEPAALNGGV